MTILLVEDDMALAAGLLFTFEEEGFDTIHARTAADANAVDAARFDIAVLDLMLPDGSGYDICQNIRAKSSVPILFLTACDDEINVVMGLDIGADDYITKPFRLKELMSRIKAHLRRSGTSTSVCAGDVVINVENSTAAANGNDLQLTLTELKLLTMLAQNTGKTITRANLLDKIWDYKGDFIDDNTLSVHIRHIREKLADSKSTVRISTIRGLGYRLEVE